jgi:TetR/AcrR family acrAB operon transcriptional repressor
MVRRTKEDTEKTRETLLDAAEAVFLEKGVAATTLEDIARTAGMTRGAVYWHFDNKQDVFDAMHERVKLPLDQSYEHVQNAENPFLALKEHCLYVLRHLTRDEHARRVMTILMMKCEEVEACQSNVDRQRQKRDEVIAKFTVTFTEAQKKNLLNAALAPETAAVSLHAFIHGILRDALSIAYPYDINALAPEMIDIFFKGLQ